MNSKQKLMLLMAKLDKLIESQLSNILEQDKLLNLRATWTGLHYLVKESSKEKKVKIRILNTNWCTLRKDLLRSPEIGYSQIFQKVHNDEFDMAGGEPFSLLLGDYNLDVNSVSNPKANSDIEAVKLLSMVAASSFTIVALSINASILGLNHYRELSGQANIFNTLQGRNHHAWHNFRNSESSRFVSLLMPKVLMNSYYTEIVNLQRQFYGKEIMIWSNTVYAYASVFVQSYLKTGWFLEVLGMPNTELDYQGGQLRDLSAPLFPHIKELQLEQLLTEVLITSDQEQALNNEGITALMQIPQTSHAAFLSNPSVKTMMPIKADEKITGEQLATLIPYMLCVCRFAHYLKVIAREQLGRYHNISDCEYRLNHWLSQYIASNTDINFKMKTRFPLSSGEVKIALARGHNEHYLCLMKLSPQLKTNHACAAILLKTSFSAIH